MRIMVTGLSSFMGDKLLKELREGCQILSLGRRELKTNNKNVKYVSFDDSYLSEKVKEFDPEIFLNIASERKYKLLTVGDYKGIVEFNIAFSSYLVDLAISSGVKLIINISSNWGYLEESDNPKFPNYYAFTKFALDKYLQNACRLSNCKSISLILYDNFDIEDPRGKLFNQILEAIEKKIIRKFSPGKQILNITRMDEIVKAIKFTLYNNWDIKNHKYYQITGNEISVIDLANMISKILNKSNSYMKFGALPYRDFEIMKPKYLFEELPFIGKRKISLMQSFIQELSKNK